MNSKHKTKKKIGSKTAKRRKKTAQNLSKSQKTRSNMMDNFFGDNSFGDDLFGDSVKCSPITQAELNEAYSSKALTESTTIRLDTRSEEDRQGDARTKTHIIQRDGPVVFSYKVFSMNRLLWADGFMQVPKTDKMDNTTATTTKATFVVLKLNLDSHTKSSGAGKNRAIQSARIQVEFHGTGPDADTVKAQRPVVVGWAPFATIEKDNETTAKEARSRSLRATLGAGAMNAKSTVEGTASDTREWSKTYFDLNRSHPVSVSDRAGESSDFNGVVWEMEHNRLAGDGVKPELLLYLLVTRQDDSEYAVKITANVDTDKVFGYKEHRCIIHAIPKEANHTEPAVCYLEGKKMWQKLDVNHFEALLSAGIDPNLKLPWDMEAMASTKNEGVQDEDKEHDNIGGGSQGADDGEIGDAAETEQNTTLTVGVSWTKEQSEHSVEGKSARPTKNGDVKTPSDDSAAILDALLGLSAAGGVSNSYDKEEEDLHTRMITLESRIEQMEYSIARQALLIRALLRRRG